MSKRFWKGIFEENPVLVLMLGLCPALGTTTAVKPALAMGIATAIVLIAVELVMTLLSHAVRGKVFMVVSVLLTAVLTSIAEYVMAQNFPELHEELGIYLPLMAISSVILSRVSAVSKSGSLAEALGDSLGMGIGFVLALATVSSVRELLGAGTWFGLQVMPEGFQPVAAFSMAPGAFFTVAFLAAAMNVKARRKASETDREGE